ncbi:hypothetical protein BDB01DRAFT_775276 [Pilobolus umbonatus]|nr:hypothetical protein BDB01DRAFT_775276 [Pilobolus umbonatus]
MKFSSAIIISTLAVYQLVSAQSTCTAQDILDLCLTNQDIYLKTCISTDYACLCQWHSAKLSCFDNCPNDVTRHTQMGLRDTFCSIASTYATTTAPAVSGPVSSSAAVAPTPAVSDPNTPNSVPSGTTDNTTLESTTPKSQAAATKLNMAGSSLLLSAACVAGYYML